jgi:hypothetical protein
VFRNIAGLSRLSRLSRQVGRVTNGRAFARPEVKHCRMLGRVVLEVLVVFADVAHRLCADELEGLEVEHLPP